MGKTSYYNMRELSKKINEQIKKVEEGKLKLEELEELVNDSRELYEKLLILKYKAYEKFGQPEEIRKESKPEVAAKEETPIEEETIEEQEEVFDLTGEPEEVEQPSFDFSMYSFSL